MKLEIDISDRNELNKTRAELQRLLNVVEFAISEMERKHQNGNGSPELVLEIPRSDDAPIRDIIGRMPKQFSTTDVVLAMGDDGKEKRGLIKSALKRAVENGVISVSVQGRGRCPTEFEKVEKP